MKSSIGHVVLGIVGGAVCGAIFGFIVAKALDYNTARITASCAGAGVIGVLTDLWMQSTS